MARQSRRQKKIVERVMHEFKHGELTTARGRRRVKEPRQAIAIALHETGASKYETPKKNRENLQRTERRARTGSGSTRAELYEQAKRRDIPGRSKMNKAELERALRG